MELVTGVKWLLGDVRTLAFVACCPQCGSVEVRHRKTRGRISYWDCKACRINFKVGYNKAARASALK